MKPELRASSYNNARNIAKLIVMVRSLLIAASAMVTSPTKKRLDQKIGLLGGSFGLQSSKLTCPKKMRTNNNYVPVRGTVSR